MVPSSTNLKRRNRRFTICVSSEDFRAPLPLAGRSERIPFVLEKRCSSRSSRVNCKREQEVVSEKKAESWSDVSFPLALMYYEYPFAFTQSFS